jgi:hypothetical protein
MRTNIIIDDELMSEAMTLHDDRDFDPMVSHFSLKTPTPR